MGDIFFHLGLGVSSALNMDLVVSHRALSCQWNVLLRKLVFDLIGRLMCVHNRDVHNLCFVAISVLGNISPVVFQGLS